MKKFYTKQYTTLEEAINNISGIIIQLIKQKGFTSQVFYNSDEHSINQVKANVRKIFSDIKIIQSNEIDSKGKNYIKLEFQA